MITALEILKRMFFRNTQPIEKEFISPNGLVWIITETGFYLKPSELPKIQEKIRQIAIKESLENNQNPIS